jgi:hypothetical protein
MLKLACASDWGPVNPVPSPPATLERITKLAVDAGKARARAKAKRAKGATPGGR